MKPSTLLATAALAVLASAVAASADTQIVVAGGTTVAASFAAGTEKHVYTATIPAGAKVSLAVKTAKKGPQLTAKFADPAGKSLGEKTGGAPSFKGLVAAASGNYALTVTSADGVATGGYSLVVSWKTPTRSAKTVAVDPDGTGTVTFSADRGATATISLKKAKGSAAVPVLASIESADGPTPLAAGPSATVNLSGTGDYVVRFGAGAAGGGVKATVAVKPPKVSRIAFPLASVAGGAHVELLTKISLPGGSLGIVEGPLTGASITVPAGAVPSPTTFLLGSGFTVAGAQPGSAAGPTIFVGPEGLTFPDGKAVTVKIPFDASAFDGDVSKLRVYTRDATGAVTLVPNPFVDLVNHFVSFPAAHFSSFQVLSDFHFSETQRIESISGTTTTALGSALALSGDIAAAARHVPASNSWEVAVFHRTGATFTEEAVLTPTGFQANDGFANTPFAVAASGDRVLVGAPGRTTTFGIHSGAGFVFHRDSSGIWSLEAELSLPTWQTNDNVGATLALDGDTALLAAPSGAGAVHVFVRDATSGVWSLQQTLTASTGTSSFGYQPTLQGDTAVVLGYGANAQRLHVFRRAAGVWAEAGRIEAPQMDGSVGNFASPKIDGTTIAAVVLPTSGAPSEIRVYEDEGTTFPQVARLPFSGLTGPGETPGFGFRNVSVRGDLLLAGAPSVSPVLPGGAAALNQAGGAFLYRRVGGVWRFTTRLRGTPNDAFPLAAQDGFGSSVALDGTTAIVAAIAVQTADGRVGALYAFDLSGN
jgi:hypothetical protein